MIRNKKIKIMLMFFALAMGSQSMHGYWLEPITKTLSENKIATVMSLSTLVLGYICYCYRNTNNQLRDINKELVINFAKKNDIIKGLKKKITKFEKLFNSLKKSNLEVFKPVITRIHNGEPVDLEDVPTQFSDIVHLSDFDDEQDIKKLANIYLKTQKAARTK